MKLVCWLSMAQPEMAQAEVLALMQVKDGQVLEDVFIVDVADWLQAKRLALTRSLYEFWFACPLDSLWQQIDKVDWNARVTGSFSVNVHHAKGLTNKKVADRIWHWLKTPVVKLKNPDTAITFFIIDGTVVCGKFLWANGEDFNKRAPHTRQGKQAIGCHPRLARALVNLTGVPAHGQLLDPFCGPGGLLIEAGLMGIRVHGSDIDQEMIDQCHANLQHFKIEGVLNCKDALHLYSPEKYVVTDLPYGRGSGKRTPKELEKLYESFFEKLAEFLRVRAVVVGPTDVPLEKLAKKVGLVVKQSFAQYVHKSLTRRILVLEPQKKDQRDEE